MMPAETREKIYAAIQLRASYEDVDWDVIAERVDIDPAVLQAARHDTEWPWICWQMAKGFTDDVCRIAMEGVRLSEVRVT